MFGLDTNCNDCRENTEKLIEMLWELSSKTGHKTA